MLATAINQVHHEVDVTYRSRRMMIEQQVLDFQIGRL